jgi:hypothetical protein
MSTARRKHGVADEDAIHAAEGYLVAYPLSDDDQEGPRRELRLGPDRAGNLLEIVVLLLDENVPDEVSEPSRPPDWAIRRNACVIAGTGPKRPEGTCAGSPSGAWARASP